MDLNTLNAVMLVVVVAVGAAAVGSYLKFKVLVKARDRDRMDREETASRGVSQPAARHHA